MSEGCLSSNDTTCARSLVLCIMCVCNVYNFNVYNSIYLICEGLGNNLNPTFPGKYSVTSSDLHYQLCNNKHRNEDGKLFLVKEVLVFLGRQKAYRLP